MSRTVWRGAIPTTPIELVAAHDLPNLPGVVVIVNDSEGPGGIVTPTTPYLLVDTNPVSLSPQSGIKVLPGDISPTLVLTPVPANAPVTLWLVASAAGGHASLLEVLGEP